MPAISSQAVFGASIGSIERTMLAGADHVRSQERESDPAVPSGNVVIKRSPIDGGAHTLGPEATPNWLGALPAYWCEIHKVKG